MANKQNAKKSGIGAIFHSTVALHTIMHLQPFVKFHNKLYLNVAPTAYTSHMQSLQ